MQNDREHCDKVRELYVQDAVSRDTVDKACPTIQEFRARRRRRHLAMRLLFLFLTVLAVVLYFGFQYYAGL